MKAALGPTDSTIWVQRGYRHYGQPHDETLKGFVEIIDNPEDTAFASNGDRLCTCDCSYCSGTAPHSISNCMFKCDLEIETLTQDKISKLGLHQPCNCACGQCMAMPQHDMETCMFFCEKSKFVK